ncbi:MAG: hypothetical protein ABI461_10515 [Polyangiaceae bacterium]
MHVGHDPRPASRQIRHRASGVALRLGAASLFLAVVAPLGAGCANTDDNQVNAPVDLGMTDTMAPYYSDQELTLYQAQIPVKLPIRAPTADEAKALGKLAPYPHAPFLSSTDIRVQVRFTLSNIDDKPHAVEMLFDAWNEFDRYKPGIQIVSDDQTTPDFSTNDKFFIVPAKGRVQGTLTSDDTSEMEIDLATAEAIMAGTPPLGADVSANALMNHAMNLQNRSTQPDPLLQSWIPKGAVPGLTGFDLGIRTSEPANVAVEITIDLTDLNGNRIIPQGNSEKAIGIPPKELVPPKAPANN